MADPRLLSAQAVDIPAPELHEAEVLDEATALGQAVRCVVPSFDGNLTTDPLPWQPYVTSAGAFYPKKDDRAVLSYQVDGTPVIAWWTPSATSPDKAIPSSAEVAGMVPKSLVDAKGDLFVGTADNTVARLGIGANSRTLVADSTQSAGMKWGIADFGIVEALPGSPSKGDRCTYKAATGVYWELVYTEEESKYWEKIGGPPLIGEANTERATSSTTYASLPTDPIAITAPLAGDYRIEVQAGLTALAANQSCFHSFAVGATVETALLDSRSHAQLGAAAGTLVTEGGKLTHVTGIAAATAITEKVRSGGAYETRYARRRLILDPVRVS